ncbi:hypothetical protein COT66_00385 [Candidatus Shapirobacteria bacterium CG09_land_8_20_14_0_10_49_15]|uniref:Glycosyltransferase family 1 protein n=2 Tax=Candidatus Shapironibacteriota TaxID=1752721 RepID=A0A2M8L6Y2_9BACT|nr:MAG: hypothetical protein COT66_00385 [Candidatus Shapirobacteria bacterium CG09_land_8_20_14_0_10_49_15]PJE70010.1 MAG: hypothetical protein COU97_01970 [Candidatus Shapirobacteria bacterium CG10_big_fil_rev_8_21_14_0_10_48_15]
MKVALDLSPLYSAHQYRGIGFYTKRLITALQAVAQEQAIELALIKDTDRTRFLAADLIHYPYFSPFFLSLPGRPLLPSVVTVHDLTPVKYPQHFPAGVRGRWRWQSQKRRLQKMAAVLTDSQAWRQQIAAMTGFPLEKIYSVPLAAGEEFKKLKIENCKLKIKKKYPPLADTFLLYVGDVNWNKNIPGLLRGFADFSRHNPTFQLVLVGKAFEQKALPEIKELLQLIKSLSLDDKIRILGFVPTNDLVAIYNLASVYCQPSFDEGFGLPVLEAMACGCPVVAAKVGSLPEICGQAAVMINPQSNQEIAEGIKKALGRGAELSQKGVQQAAAFSWKRTAAQTIAVYKKACAGEE